MSPRLNPCPTTPNCVSSDATKASQSIPGFHLATDRTWPELLAQVATSPRARLAAKDETFAHFVFTTRLLRFRDDVHLELRGREVALRSCSRTGTSDFGTNRRRIEALRQTLLTAGIIDEGSS